MGLLALLLLCLINPGMGTNLMLDQIEQSQNQQLDPPTFLRPNDMNFFGEKSNLSSNSNSQVPNSLADVFISNNVPLRQKQGRYEEQSRRVMTTAPVEDAQVNMYTLSDQSSCQTAALKDGSFVVVWQSSGQDGSGLGVYARKYSASATSFNGEFQVNTNITSDQSSPSVGALLDGGFIIAWVSDGQDGDQGGIYAQRYNADGTRYGLEFRVNDVTPNLTRMVLTLLALLMVDMSLPIKVMAKMGQTGDALQNYITLTVQQGGRDSRLILTPLTDKKLLVLPHS